MQIHNTSASALTLDLWIANTLFTFPTAPPPVRFDSNVSYTSISGSTGTGTIDMTSCLDENDGTAPPTDPFCSGGGAHPVVHNQLTYLPSPDSGQTYVRYPLHTADGSLGTPYSLSRSTLTIEHEGGVEHQRHSPVPPDPDAEPASIVLLGTMLLGVTGLLRKKFKRA